MPLSLDVPCLGTADGRFVKVNKAFEELLGYPACEVEGMSFQELPS